MLHEGAMKQFLQHVRVGLVLAAIIGTACSRTEPTDTNPEIGQIAQAISLAPMAWPATWTPLQLNGVNLSDPTGDTQGSRDVVGTAASPAVYVSTDANRMFFRMRLGTSPLKTATSLDPFGWACEIDGDLNNQTYEFIANVNGIVNGDAVSFSQNTVQGSIDSPSDKAELSLQQYSALVDNAQGTTPAHTRVVFAGTNLGATGGDYFIDWAIDLNDFPNTFNPFTTPFRLICGSSANAQNISADPVSASAATTISALASDLLTCSATGCVPGCRTDSNCLASQFCNTQSHVCVSKLANATPIPTITGHTPALTGACTPAVGTSVCTSAVCNATDDRCGFADGDGPCNGTTGPTVCRSGVCSSGGVCVSSGPCTLDSQCTTSQFCNTQTTSCGPKLANGVAIPTVTGHTPALTGVCNVAVGTAVCTSAVCDTADNRCGYANGDGPCSVGNGATVCRGGACSATALRCMPVGGCVADADCASTSYCDTSLFACAPKLLNGANITTIAGHTPALNGACTVGAGASVCVSAVCDAADNKCGFADGDGTCNAANAAVVCRSAACSVANVCAPAGGCVADGDCAPTQFCNTATALCLPKLINGTTIPMIVGHTPALTGACSVAVGTAICAAGVCDTVDDKCGFANGDGTCNNGNASTLCRGGACSPNANKCMPVGGCVVDADCASGSFCDNSVFACKPKLANGVAVPTIAGHTPPLTGMCTVAAGTAVCAAGVCDSTDNKCGFADGDGTCTVGTAATVCRSGFCSTTGVCAPAGGCLADADCTLLQFCNTSTSACVTKLGNGNAVPTIAGHAPALTGACSVAVGTAVCAAGVCDTVDDKCGFANGDGTCTNGNAATLCRGGACSPNANKCMPIGGCVVDADCAAGAFCDNSVFACKPKLANGVAVPTIAGHTPPLTGMCTVAAGTAVCAAGVCDTTDNQCGFANGDGTCTAGTAATVCRSGFCSTTGVCAPAGSCLADADCTSLQFCDTATSACVTKLGNGTALPTIAGHTPVLDGTCTAPAGTAICAAGVCDSTDNRCGFANGTGPCTSVTGASVCRVGACGSDNLCGKVDGEVCNAPGDCRSGTCSSNMCGPTADAGTDSGTDSGTDAGDDSGVDAGSDSGLDAGTDSGRLDAGADTGVADSGNQDSGSADSGSRSDATTSTSDAGQAPDDGILEGGGLACAVQASSSSSANLTGLFFAALGMASLLRRRQGSKTDGSKTLVK